MWLSSLKRKSSRHEKQEISMPACGLKLKRETAYDSRARVCCVVGYVSAGGCRKEEGGWNSVPNPPLEECCGGVLLSHTLPGAVPSALAGLASRFGMEAGRFPAAMTTTRWFNQYSHIPPLVGGLCWL